MHKLKTFIRYLADFLQYGQIRLVIASIIYIATGKSFIETRIFRGKLGFFLHRKGSLDFQFGNYAYEWNVKKFVLRHLHQYDIFLDVGANIGTYTIMMTGHGLKSFAFEPVYSNHKALTINILLNNFEDKATAFNFGLSDESTTASFAFDPLNTGASHISTVPAETPEAAQRSIPIEIKLLRLDDVMGKMNLDPKSKVLMKVDVEGMECQVLKGAKNFIKTFPEIMLVMESIHSGEKKLKEILNEMAIFEYHKIDDLNMCAIKKGELV